MTYFYLSRNAILNEKTLCTYITSEKKVENFSSIQNWNDIIEFIGIYLPNEWEYSPIIDSIYDLSTKPNDMIKAEWNGYEWIETATVEEIEKNKLIKNIKFYNDELEFASKATAELACEIISSEVFEEVKIYMNAINPYIEAKHFKTLQRPKIFERYEYEGG